MKYLNCFHKVIALSAIATLSTCFCHAAPISAGNILSSYAFTSGAFLPGSQSFNIWDDNTGALLTSDNGDWDDITIIYSTSSTVGSGGVAGNTGLTYNASTDRFVTTQAFTGGVSSNNPGSRVTNSIEIQFASHVNITALPVDFISLNTAGIAWEFSYLGYLKPNYTGFTSDPIVSAYLSSLSMDGMNVSQGWFMNASTGTVNNVGTNLTTAGASGTYENLTATNGNGFLDYVDVGLAAGTQVGGFHWTTILEDVRGINNISTSFTTSLSDFSPAGSIVPETSSVFYMLFSSFFLLRRKKIKR